MANPGCATMYHGVMDEDTKRELRHAQRRVTQAQTKLATHQRARDATVRRAIDAGASRYAIAKIIDVSQPAVMKMDLRTSEW